MYVKILIGSGLENLVQCSINSTRIVSASTSDATPAETFLTDGRGIIKSCLIAHDDRIAMMTLLRHMRELDQVFFIRISIDLNFPSRRA